MFKCKETNKVFVVCPAHGRTGGLELLHQLVFTLNKMGINAAIAYTKIKQDRPVINPAYRCYVSDYVRFKDIKDSSENIVIISEHQIEFMDQIKSAKVAIWWLSVDNYLKVYSPSVAYKYFGCKGVLWYLKNRRWRYKVAKINTRIGYNFAQSYYAIDYLQKNNFSNIHFLSDYISQDYLDVNFNTGKQRNDVVLYNPKKGKKFSEYLMHKDNSIKWIPLINLTNDQVRELLLTSKVYVDFGNHPGKDRFPREAAYCGCCVITDKKGAAKFFEDVPIPEEYKFEDIPENGEKIIARILECFKDYDKDVDNFKRYRDMIAGEYDKFNNDVKHIFIN